MSSIDSRRPIETESPRGAPSSDASDGREKLEKLEKERLFSTVSGIEAAMREVAWVPVTPENANRFASAAEIIGRLMEQVGQIRPEDRGDLPQRVDAIAGLWEKHVAESISMLPQGSPDRAELEARFLPYDVPAPFYKVANAQSPAERP